MVGLGGRSHVWGNINCEQSLLGTRCHVCVRGGIWKWYLHVWRRPCVSLSVVVPTPRLVRKTWWWPNKAETCCFTSNLRIYIFYIRYELCCWLPSHLSSLPTQRGWHFCCLCVLGNRDGLFVSNLSSQPVGPIFNSSNRQTAWLLMTRPTGHPETSFRNYLCSCVNPQKSKDLIYIAAETGNNAFLPTYFPLLPAPLQWRSHTCSSRNWTALQLLP